MCGSGAARRIVGFIILAILAVLWPDKAIAAQCVIADYVSFIATLRSKGIAVKLVGKVTQPFFAVQGQRIVVDGETAQAFQYRDAALAAKAANRVLPDRYKIGPTRVEWVYTPHFYRCGRLIVLYVGDNLTLLKELVTLFGPRFSLPGEYWSQSYDQLWERISSHG